MGYSTVQYVQYVLTDRQTVFIQVQSYSIRISYLPTIYHYRTSHTPIPPYPHTPTPHTHTPREGMNACM